MSASIISGDSLLLLLAKATVILCGAVLITRSLHRASAGVRHLIWLVTLGMMFVVPALTVWGPLHLAILPPASESVDAGSSRKSIESPRSASPSSLRSPINAPATLSATSHASGPIDRAIGALGSMSAASLAIAIWGVVVLGIVAALAWAGFSVHRITRGARRLTSHDWQGPLVEIADRLGLDDVPLLLQSNVSKMPFACGVLTPTVVLPAEASTWSLDRRRAVLLHELAHVRRRDLLGHTVGRLACAVYWFHPLVWTAATRLRSESERACDDLALSCGTRASDYAEHLLDIVTSVRADRTPLVALAMARRHEFEGRMLAILDPELPRTSPSRRQSTALIGSLALMAMVVGAAAPVPREAHAILLHTSTAGTTPSGTVASALVARDGHDTPHTSRHATPTPANAAIDAIRDRSLATIGAPDAQKDNGDSHTDDRPDLLAKILKTDASAQLRRIAAWGLQEYTDSPAALDALTSAVRGDDDASVREMSAWALGTGGASDDLAVSALGGALRHDAAEKVRATAAWSLGTIGDNAGIDALVEALDDASKSVRSRAVWALGTVGPKTAPRALMTLLGDPDPDTRELAAWALYQIDDPATAPAIEAALKKEQDKDVQLADIRAIAVMGEKSVDALRGLLESSDPSVKAMAVRALAGGHAAGPWPRPWPEPRPAP